MTAARMLKRLLEFARRYEEAGGHNDEIFRDFCRSYREWHCDPVLSHYLPLDTDYVMLWLK